MRDTRRFVAEAFPQAAAAAKTVALDPQSELPSALSGGGGD